MPYFFLFLLLLSFSACKQNQSASLANQATLWTPYDQAALLAANSNHEQERMRYRFIQSKVLDKNKVFAPLYTAVAAFPTERYLALKPFVLEQDIPSIQQAISAGKMTYEELVLFYLHRIYRYELEATTSLNAIIALNPKVLEEARQRDKAGQGDHPIYGMPILLKDNIGTAAMKTTAGAAALLENQTADAFIVRQLQAKGALILGKVNLSEWANFLCDVCPNGQSAVGGQTLNPYGPRSFDTGGSSAGSGVSAAANYAVATVGTETSGSILSPSSQNSVVGLKPTVGLLSRTGIVPISSTLDTPGPMTKNVTDNAILLDAMLGYDKEDARSLEGGVAILADSQVAADPKKLRLGVMQNLQDRDSLYAAAVAQWQRAGAELVFFDPPQVPLNNFLQLLNADMAIDMKAYLAKEVKDSKAVPHRSMEDLLYFNQQDTSLRIPYGQARFEGVVADTTSEEALEALREELKTAGRSYFQILEEEQLDAILSINNYHAGYAAVAHYPALTVPMGYQPSGEPKSLTFIGKPFSEASLLRMGRTFEALSPARKIPEKYKN